MCGIFFSAHFPTSETSEDRASFEHLSETLKKANALRGPDAQKNQYITLLAASDEHPALSLHFYASELRLRGEDYTVDQPHFREPDGDVLCWNGEIFAGLDVMANENDGVRLYETLSACKSAEQVRDVFASIEGPYAFVLYLKVTNQLIFGRDPLGRRSLLMLRPTQNRPYFVLTSVACRLPETDDCCDLPTERLYCLELNALAGARQATVVAQYLTSLPRTHTQLTTTNFATAARVNRMIPLNDWPLSTGLDTIPAALAGAVDGLIEHLDRAVKLRVQNISRRAQDTSDQTRVGVLFSGGIDCTILAYLAHRYLPDREPIDLLNVAFENPRIGRSIAAGKQGRTPERGKGPQPLANYVVPDRQTGIEEVEELRALCPGRTWNFVEINVTCDEYASAKGYVEDLIFPNKTVMDLSLAMALYFASRGIGHLREHKDADPEPYISPARVLLSGLGSDELLGGYGRHRSAYNRDGWLGVIDELQLDVDRIPVRNLGRDDRVVSSHGKETRHPFLSMSMLNFIVELPVHYKMDPRAEQGLGDKLLLRLATYKLGLVEASRRKKRAMQFGSRSARMDDDSKGDVVLARGT